MKSYTIAIVGATGAVGREILKLLESSTLPIAAIRCFASPSSFGKKIEFKEEQLCVETLSLDCFSSCDIVLFSAGGKVSKQWVPIALDAGAFVIDASSYFRMSSTVPLIIPEINPHAYCSKHQLVASPNCSTTIMLMALAPLHRYASIKRIVVATYQAASGAGFQAMQELQEETRAFLEGKPFERKIMPFPYAFNVFTPYHSARTNITGATLFL